MSQTFSFDPDTGALYARSFALYDYVPPAQRLFFHAEDDCTNFISQCVWAAYGGWLPGFTKEKTDENAGRIRRNIRQVKGVWYGSSSFVGSNKWCRVEEFYAFVTGRKERGPSARLIAEGDFNRVDPAVIQKGDVVQLVVASYTPDRYGHSLYVTVPGTTWQGVKICCHTYDRLDAPMTEFTQYPDVYRKLRVLRFGPAVFDA